MAENAPVARSESDKQVLIVPHSHWDREWYWSLGGYRHRLIDLLDDVIARLSDPDRADGLPVFWMDGQVSPLLDYLESKPERAEVVKQLVGQGELRIGPWFVQGDEHLVDGEACVRNLLLGARYGAAFGPLQSVGYVPDQFGHTAQLPQILVKAGIDNAVLWRSVVDQKGNRLFWQGPDGSRVLLLWLPDSYANAMELPEDVDGAVAKLKECIAKDRAHDADGIRLMMAGVDHALPAPGLAQAAGRLGEEWGIPVRIVGLDEVVAAARAKAGELPEVSGELLFCPALYGCWSSRTYLKQANDRCCRILESWAEPLAALALWEAGIDLRGELHSAWKELVLNHPHDSICGCSDDKVHRAMMPRFDFAEDVGRTVALRSGRALQLAAAFPGRRLDVLTRAFNEIQDRAPHSLGFWNATNRAISESVVFDVNWPEPDASALEIHDGQGRLLESQVIEREAFMFRRWRPNGNPTRHQGRRFRLAVQPIEAMSAFGLTQWRVDAVAAAGQVDHTQESARKVEAAPAPAARVRCGLTTLENEHLRLEVFADGSCSLLHKATGRTYERLCTLVDSGESGDSYGHIRPMRDECITAQSGTIAATVAGPLYGEIKVNTVMQLPEGRSEDKCGRSPRRVPCEAEVRYSLGAGWPYVKVAVDFENRVLHHQLQVRFPTGAAIAEYVACVPFASLKRKPLPVAWQQTERGQMPQWPDGWPQLGWVDLPGRGANLAIVAPGTPQYDIDADGVCKVNLLRTFDSLIWGWEPMYPFPEGQCLGRNSFQLALYPHARDAAADKVHAVAETAALGPYAIAGESLPESLLTGPIVQTEPSAVRVTALKPAQEGEGLILRLLNDGDKPVEAALRLHWADASITEVDLLERPVATPRKMTTAGGEIRLPLRSYEFVTLRLDRPAGR